MTPPAGTLAAHIAAREAQAKARGITDPEELAAIRRDARDVWESRLSRDPQTYQPL